MKAVQIFIVSVALIAFGYFVAPKVLKAMGYEPTYSELEEIGPVYTGMSEREPGLVEFRDLDEVKFTYLRAFHDKIEISAFSQGPNWKNPEPYIETTRTSYSRGPDQPPKIEYSSEQITAELFEELAAFVTREDMFDISYAGTDIGYTDGSWWILEGRKKDLVIEHRRRCPLQIPEKKIIAIGLRFLEIADIDIATDEIY